MRIGSLFRAAREIELAWQIRSEIADALQVRIADDTRPPTTADFEQLFLDHPRSRALPVALLDARCRIVAANDAFLSSTGYAPTAIVDRSLEVFIHPDTRALERANLERLVSGEFDYLDIPGLRVLPDGREMAYVCHRAAVRHPDATLKYIVTVARPLHMPTTLVSS